MIETDERSQLKQQNKQNNMSKSKNNAPKAQATNPNPGTSAATPAAPKQPALKKGPSPVFSIPATKADKEFITLQSTRTGVPQKELLAKAIEAGKAAIEALPKYVAPEVPVKAKAAKANEAEAALAMKASAPAPAPAASTPATEPVAA